jgi:MFS superfamily sulfate permease-like transporter
VATPGTQSAPGLIVFRYDADLFYANANRFSDDVQALITGAPDPVRWLVLDCTSIPDVDYSAGLSIDGLIAFVHQRGAVFALAGLDPDLDATLRQQGVLRMLNSDHLYGSVADAVAAFRAHQAPHPSEPNGGAVSS